MQDIQMLIVDMGSQYTLVIGRLLREIGVRSAILSPKKAGDWLKTNKPKGIILSGGDASVYQEGAPSPPDEIYEVKVPILGICYGMQWLVKNRGGKIGASVENKEYGETKITLYPHTAGCLFNGIVDKEQVVWASHGDSVQRVPPGYNVIAQSQDGTIAGIGNLGARIWGLQFHPEVKETPCGNSILSMFVFPICGCALDWSPRNIVGEIRQEVKEVVGDRRAICGFSGGVDSSVLTAVVAPVLGENFRAICINTGSLRQDELDEIRANARSAGVEVKIVDAADRFQAALVGIIDAEEKRAAFRRVYVCVLEEEASEFDAEILFQGSLATDFIESGGAGEAVKIKTHHNIDLDIELEELHPFSALFKYEIREIARSIDLPVSITERQPFPGPGLFIRIVGAPVDSKKLSIVRWADALVTKILKNCGIYQDVSQLVVALNCVRSVGIKGDARVYAYSIIVRAVETSDFMTAVGHQFPADTRRQITTEVTKHSEIVRVFFDETNKPPATTELE